MPQHLIMQIGGYNIKVKENKIMGLSCKKQTGKFKSIMRKMENQLEAEKKATKKKEAKKSKTNISKQQR